MRFDPILPSSFLGLTSFGSFLLLMIFVFTYFSEFFSICGVGGFCNGGGGGDSLSSFPCWYWLWLLGCWVVTNDGHRSLEIVASS